MALSHQWLMLLIELLFLLGSLPVKSLCLVALLLQFPFKLCNLDFLTTLLKLHFLRSPVTTSLSKSYNFLTFQQMALLIELSYIFPFLRLLCADLSWMAVYWTFPLHLLVNILPYPVAWFCKTTHHLYIYMVTYSIVSKFVWSLTNQQNP